MQPQNIKIKMVLAELQKIFMVEIVIYVLSPES